jgi:hypothetical protein
MPAAFMTDLAGVPCFGRLFGIDAVYGRGLANVAEAVLRMRAGLEVSRGQGMNSNVREATGLGCEPGLLHILSDNRMVGQNSRWRRPRLAVPAFSPARAAEHMKRLI